MSIPEGNPLKFSMLNDELRKDENSRIDFSDTNLIKLLGDSYSGGKISLSDFRGKSFVTREPPEGYFNKSGYFIQVFREGMHYIKYNYTVRWNNMDILYRWQMSEDDFNELHSQGFYDKDGWRYYRADQVFFHDYGNATNTMFGIYRIKA